MTTSPTSPLTANSTVDTWLHDPRGGSLLRELLSHGGIDEDSLAPARGLPLQQLVALSQGKLPQSVVDGLVAQANDGVIPADAPGAATAGSIVAGRFTGQTVVVTGAAAGIGRATATRIAHEGGRVIAVDITADHLHDMRTSLADYDVVTVAGDITNSDTIDRVIAAAGARIDGLANVAGVNDDFAPLHETTDAMWDRVIGINLTGAFRLNRAVLPAMLNAGRGSIVNVASEAGLRGNASGNAYTVSKHGVIGLTVNAAFMYGPEGIRVNAVAPGGVVTGIASGIVPSPFGRSRLAPFLALIPPVALPEQLAASITFLLSDDANNINGAVLPSDGGWSVQ